MRSVLLYEIDMPLEFSFSIHTNPSDNWVAIPWDEWQRLQETESRFKHTSWHEQNSKHYKIPGAEAFEYTTCLQIILKQLKKEIFALWSLSIYLLDYILPSAFLQVHRKFFLQSVTRFSWSCVQLCEEWISSGWPNQDNRNWYQ